MKKGEGLLKKGSVMRADAEVGSSRFMLHEGKTLAVAGKSEKNRRRDVKRIKCSVRGPKGNPRNTVSSP